MFELAGALLPATAAWPVGEVAVEDWGRVNLGEEKFKIGITQGNSL